MDEWISAGDAAFIEQAHARLKSFTEKSGTLAIASHSVDTLRQWCNKGIFLVRGGVVAMGPLEEVIARYQG